MGYKVSGKRSGPPPKRGPNPNVPPVKLQFGGGADMGAPSKAKERAAKGYGSVGPVERDTGLERQRQANIISKASQPDSLKDKFTGSMDLGKSLLMYGASKALNLPMGALTVAKNLFAPKVSDMTLGKNLNDYDPMFNTARYNTPPIQIGGGDNQRGLCPDGTMPPCKVVTAFKGKYFDEQTTNVKGKNKTGPVPGGNTPQIPGSEYLKYKKFKKNKVVSAYVGKAVKQPTETKKEFSMRHAEHTPFGKRGGGIAIRGMNFKGVL